LASLGTEIEHDCRRGDPQRIYMLRVVVTALSQSCRGKTSSGGVTYDATPESGSQRKSVSRNVTGPSGTVSSTSTPSAAGAWKRNPAAGTGVTSRPATVSAET